MFFWDVGANIGVFSLYAGLKPNARVLAFEPAGALRRCDEDFSAAGAVAAHEALSESLIERKVSYAPNL